MNTYFTSDLHFGHRNIINFCRRPFHSVDNMNRLLILNWNEVVKPEDTVYVLGDVAMGKIAESLPLVEKLQGRKLLVPGNHDRCWPGHGAEKAAVWKEVYERHGFEVLDNEVVIEHEGRSIRLCHFPYATHVGEYDTRYMTDHPHDDGLPLFHGHIHQTWRSQPRMVNVGVDVWSYVPVSIERLVEELDRNP